MWHSSNRENQQKLTMREISTYISSILSLVKLSVQKIFNIWNHHFFPSTAGSRHPTLAFAPAHIVDDSFATLATDHEDPDNLINSHGYNDHSNQGSSSDTCG